jgi:hypothetical protein
MARVMCSCGEQYKSINVQSDIKPKLCARFGFSRYSLARTGSNIISSQANCNVLKPHHKTLCVSDACNTHSSCWVATAYCRCPTSQHLLGKSRKCRDDRSQDLPDKYGLLTSSPAITKWEFPNVSLTWSCFFI